MKITVSKRCKIININTTLPAVGGSAVGLGTALQVESRVFGSSYGHLDFSLP
jgi:hypothetical protein